jgi:hypothetical protein
MWDQQEDSMSCKKCGATEIFNKKRQLCKKCTGKFINERRKHQRLEGNDYTGRHHPFLFIHRGELEFVKNYFDHRDWQYQPAMFKFNVNGEEESYTPDFYDAKKDIWIEVVTTRQAWFQAKSKWERWRSAFPKLQAEVRNPYGNLLSDAKRGDKWKFQQTSKTSPSPEP